MAQVVEFGKRKPLSGVQYVVILCCGGHSLDILTKRDEGGVIIEHSIKLC